jgi:hypothetical protein
MKVQMAKQYRGLILDFVERRVSVKDFETTYFKWMKAEPAGATDRPLFLILENLFEDLDAYSPMWTEQDENAYRITEATLRKEAETALRELDEYLHGEEDSG